jgi:hypothetical protein
MRFASKSTRKPATNTFEKSELGTEAPLSKEEKGELEQRRRAAELEGLELVRPVELKGQDVTNA